MAKLTNIGGPRAGDVDRDTTLGYVRILTKISNLADILRLKKYAQQTVHVAKVTKIGGPRAGKVDRETTLGYVRIFTKMSMLSKQYMLLQ